MEEEPPEGARIHGGGVRWDRGVEVAGGRHDCTYQVGLEGEEAQLVGAAEEFVPARAEVRGVVVVDGGDEGQALVPAVGRAAGSAARGTRKDSQMVILMALAAWALRPVLPSVVRWLSGGV